MQAIEQYEHVLGALEQIHAQRTTLAAMHGRVPDDEWSRAWDAVEATWGAALELLYKIDPDSRAITEAIRAERT